MTILFREYELLANCELFDADYYVRNNPDISNLNVDPILHFLEVGATRVLNPSAEFDTAYYLEQCRLKGEVPGNPLIHYITVGVALGLRKSKAQDTNGVTEPIERASDAFDASVRAKSASMPPPIRLEIDEAQVDEGGILVVSGWAVGYLDILAVNVFIDNELVGPADYGRVRKDVAIARKEYLRSMNSGFAFTTDVSRFGAGTRLLKVEAVTQTGVTRSVETEILVPEKLPARNQVFHFRCDNLSLSTSGRVMLTGWVICGSTTQSITVSLDGAHIGQARIGLERIDVAHAFAEFPYACNSGFSFRHDVGDKVAPGKHLIIMSVADAAGLVREIPLSVQAIEGPGDIPTAADEVSPAALASDPGDAISLSLDAPRITNGAADTPIIGSLSINGWALAPNGIAQISIAINGTVVANAQHGIRRDDVATAFPDRPDALQSGFATLVPYWLLSKGTHSVAILVRDSLDHTTSVQFGIRVEDMPEVDGPWCLRRKMSQAEVDLQMNVLAGMNWNPAFHLLVAVGEADNSLADTRRTLESVCAQRFPNWSLALIARDRRTFSHERRLKLLSGLEEFSERVKFLSPREKSTLTRLADRTRAQLFMFLSSGDELGCDGLLELALASGQARTADVLYADERRHNPVTETVQAYFKPGWSPDLLLSTNYVGRPWCAKSELIERAGLTLNDWLEDGDYDIVLKATEAANCVHHVPKVLCQRGVDHLDSEPQERRALSRSLVRRQIRGDVRRGCRRGIYRVKPKKSRYGKVSIIIPTRASRGLIKNCLNTLKSKTAYRDYEIICIENIPADQTESKVWLRENADEVLDTTEPFNWSRYNNLCAQRASGAFLLFLNDDIEILDPGWLDALLHNAVRSEVGVVGPQLLYPDRTVQHAGLALTNVIGRARHVFRHAHADDPGYFGLALTQRNVIAVTGACMLMRREVFDSLNGFDEAYSVINNDLDFCLRAWRKGLSIVYTPHAQLIHHEMVSRATLGDAFDSAAFVTAWRDVFVMGDPYLNRNLSRDSDDLVPEREPTTAICAGRPLFRRESIRRVLVLKLDHIGDCIISLPAIRKLRRHFPDARITVLSATATKLVWSMEPAVDAVLEFNFFHARSQLGQKEVQEEELAALSEQLRKQRFDIAVDLRKSPDTRPVLQCSGASFLAGFDYEGRFPWLDVALQWEGDPGRMAKRQSAGDDLVNLVDALTACGENERKPLTRKAGKLTSLTSRDARQLFEGPLVCVHAGAGNELKAWPTKSFCELIDLLVDREGVHVAMVGGPAEMSLSDEVIAAVRQPSQIRNLAGKLSLSELPDLLLRSSLFIGNDSGPKHIAAALGVPTVGIHSGNIDAREWGPVGMNAVAIWRPTSCSPCYIDKTANCHRNVACLKGIGAGEVYDLCRKMLQISRGKSISHGHRPKAQLEHRVGPNE